MTPIVTVMLCLQAAIFLAAAFAVIFRRSKFGKPGQAWSSFAVALFVVGTASLRIGDSHSGEPGVDVLLFCAPFLIGMAFICLLILIRELRGVERID